ncbi:MAG: hypothetical protein NT172_15710 [Planctomycetota bacterium]|nr:hypothetical protein [Planctomycetota bacterium]
MDQKDAGGFISICDVLSEAVRSIKKMAFQERFFWVALGMHMLPVFSNCAVGKIEDGWPALNQAIRQFISS